MPSVLYLISEKFKTMKSFFFFWYRIKTKSVMLKIFRKYLFLFLFGSLSLFVLSVFSVSSSEKKTSQLQGGGGDSASSSTPTNTNFPSSLENYWTYLKGSEGLGGYTGTGFSAPVSIGGKDYRVGWLVTLKGNDFADLGTEGSGVPKTQLQTLFDAGVTVKQFRDGIDAANNAKLDTLWTTLNLDTNLGGYTGFNPGNTDITIDNRGYRINLLITSSKTLSGTAGRVLTPEQGKDQLQKLVTAGIIASQVRSALDTANIAKLDALWTALKLDANLGGYTGYNFEDVNVNVGGTNYRLNLLIDNKDSDTDGSALDTPIKAQLQALVDGGVAATDVRSALNTANTANNTALNTLWSGLKTALTGYTGHTFTTPINISGSDYTINLLITNKADRLSGSTLTSAKGQGQLQKLVNGGITNADDVRTALDTANNDKKLDDLWTALKLDANLGGYTGYNFEDVNVNVGGTNYKLNLLIDNKDSDTDGSALDTPIKAQLQALVDGGITNVANVRSALDTANAANNTALDTLWSGLKTALTGYTGHTFTTPIDISGSDYTINLLITNKADRLSGSTLTSAKGQGQLQKLVNGGITNADDVRTALDTANNDKKLDDLWTALKLDANLGGYTGFNFKDVNVNVGGTNYKLNLLIDNKDSDTDGSALDTPIKAQLQALVDGGITNAANVRSALDTANAANNTALDTLWSGLKTALVSYTGFNFRNVNLLIAGVKDPTIAAIAGRALTDAQGKGQLQELVNIGTSAPQLRTALDIGNNNRNLNNLWTALKTALVGYTGYNFEDVDVDVGGTNYKLNLLIDHKTDPVFGSTLTDVKGQGQLQALVDGGVSASDVRSALDTANAANNTALDTLWSGLKTALTGYTGHTFTTPIDISGSDYTINLLITNKGLATAGHSLADPIKAQLQALINAGITDANAVRTALNTADNNKKLDDLWTALKLNANLGGYTGYNFEDVDVDVGGTNYRLNLLIDNKDSDTDGSALDAPIKAQLQELVDDGVAATDVRSALNAKNTANNTALDTLWSGLKTALANYAGHTFTTPIDISGSDYTINLLITNKADPLSGSTLTSAKGQGQLQKLVNGGITDAAVVRTALDDANTANNTALDTLWTALKLNANLGGYTGHTFTTPITIDGNPYTLNHLLIEKAENLASLTNNAKAQLQALVNGAITDAAAVRTALDDANTANNTALDTLWSGLKTALANYAGHTFTTPIDISGSDYNINLLITNKVLATAGHSLADPIKAQLQALINGGITDAAVVRTALDDANTANNTALDTLWTALKLNANLGGYTGHTFTTPITIDGNPYTLNHLLIEKAENLASLTNNAKAQLQALVDGAITDANAVRTALNTANNNKKLDDLWSGLKTALTDYTGHTFTTPIDISGSDYTINLLITNKGLTTAGHSLADPIKVQLQALVDGAITDAAVVRTALDDANTVNNTALDTLWTALKLNANLGGYTGHTFTTPITIDGNPYTLNHLLIEKVENLANLTNNAKTQLQALVNGGITDANAVRTALDDANNTALDTLWTTLKTALANYAGHTFTTPIDISGSDYTINLLITNKGLATAGHSLDTPIKAQLQALVDGGVSATDVRTALNTANNDALDTLWSALKQSSGLGGYTGFNPGDNNFFIRGNPYRIHLLIRNKGVATAGRDLTTEQGKTQLQKLVNAGVTVAQVRSALNTANIANDGALDTLWTALKANSGLGNYAGFNPGDNDFPIENNPYRIHLLIRNKEVTTVSHFLTPDIKAQLQALVDGGVSASDVLTALNIANNAKLDTLWIALKANSGLGNYAGFNPGDNDFDIEGNSYRIHLLIAGVKDRTIASTAGRALTDAQGKVQLQALVNAGVIASQVRSALDIANTAYNRLLDTFWSTLKTALADYAGHIFTTPITIDGNPYTLNHLLDEKTEDLANLTNNAKTQLQSLVDRGITDVAAVRTALDNADTANNTALNNLWTALKTALANYAGHIFTTPITIDGNPYTLNHLLGEKTEDLANLTNNAKTQLQKLVDGGITDAAAVRTALNVADNNKKLDDLWIALKANSGLGNYAGFNPGDNDFDIEGNSYRIHLLIAGVKDRTIASTAGYSLAEPIKVQLQALVDGSVTASQVRSALNTANAANPGKLDDLWTALKTALADYLGHIFTTPITIDGNPYTLDHLLDEKTEDLANLSDDAKTQLQTLVNGGVTDAAVVRTALDDANTANNRALDNLWTALKPALADYAGFNFENVDVEVGGKNYKLNLLIDNKADRLPGSILTNAKGQTQLQELVDGGITDADVVRSAIDTANNNRNLKTLWDTIKDEFVAYKGSVFSDQIPVLNADGSGSRGTFTINHLLTEKDREFAGLTDEAKTQLQALLDNDVADGEVGTALTLRNTNALNALWIALKTALADYAGYIFTSPITIDNNPYTLDLLIRNKGESVAGRDLTPEQGKAQLQALVDAGVSAPQVRSGLDTADNNKKLDDLWTALKQSISLGGYTGFNPGDNDFDIEGNPYRIHLLIRNKGVATAGHSLADPIKVQLQALVDGSVSALQVRTTLNTANTLNDGALNTLWIALKTALADYAGHIFTTPITIDGNPYTLNLLIDNKAVATVSHLLASDIKSQLQVLVNGGITNADAVRSALNTANNNRNLDNLWNTLKLDANLGGYTGFNPGDNDFDIEGNPYRIHLLIRNKGVATAGHSLADPIKAQLQALVDAGVSAPQVRSALDDANNTALDNLWTALKDETNLGGYTGFNPGDNDFSIEGNPYRIHLLITNKELETAGRSLNLVQGKAQLQKLLNAGITASQVRTALNTADSHRNLDTLWTDIVELFEQKGYSFSGDLITIKGKDYSFRLIGIAIGDINQKNSAGSSLDTALKDELQSLINDDVTAKDIGIYLDSLETKEDKDTNQNLAIGLGTAGGVIVLAGAAGFVYWLIKIRKS